MVCIFLCGSAVRVHDSQAYGKMNVTREDDHLMMTGSKQESITDLIRLLLKIIVRTQATRKGARLRQKEGKKKKKNGH